MLKLSNAQHPTLMWVEVKKWMSSQSDTVFPEDSNTKPRLFCAVHRAAHHHAATCLLPVSQSRNSPALRRRVGRSEQQGSWWEKNHRKRDTVCAILINQHPLRCCRFEIGCRPAHRRLFLLGGWTEAPAHRDVTCESCCGDEAVMSRPRNSLRRTTSEAQLFPLKAFNRPQLEKIGHLGKKTEDTYHTS